MDCIARETVDRGYVAIKDDNVATGERPSCVAMADTNVAAGDQVWGWECWKGRPSGVAMTDKSVATGESQVALHGGRESVAMRAKALQWQK